MTQNEYKHLAVSQTQKKCLDMFVRGQREHSMGGEHLPLYGLEVILPHHYCMA